MSQPTNERVWLVTGSASGLGAGIAKAALNNGDSVIATDLDLARLEQTYGSYDGQVLVAVLDIRDVAQAESVVEAALKRFGRIDVLVNNAGYGQFGPFEEVEPQAIERQFATNVFGTFNVTRAVLPVMRKQRWGHVINMSSNGGFKGVSGASMYSASKFAIEGFSESLAQEIANFGIKLTLVEPGAFRTDFLDSRMLKIGTRALDDYSEFRTRALEVFEARNHQQVGDPDKLGLAVVKLVEQKEPPLRFVAGADAVQVVEDKLAFVAAELSRWRALSTSTDF
ncbi:SDR family NAD(P)-dependent oxidoreductase [Pseudomonas sp. 10S4]|uniref:SDR family NAD(P)-dependent oxidoreductase n=1 Tax=Pseudomonas sp. 10S4 TaxID=3048583 RepID=UPI002AC8EA07|nr:MULTISPECIES: SDR family NAD(P)-dependent oxidoreductase [unclassified Pseudomonas]MEB0228472.1 SDR family NAD(P)-dependent oxidoreductase [Pseudomonas sp. 5S1]MEB0295821.1 SDR family NAD(P)-dependent oxidoreductase [Pseudomonas sp. 10S4]WPX18106.1 SDR family NAD(P)-dependent oxidoreductase [Pseudomonas sp. 10S4]